MATKKDNFFNTLLTQYKDIIIVNSEYEIKRARDIKYGRICVECNKIDLITYCQVYNIIKNKCKPYCKSCTGKYTTHNSGRFKKGRKTWNAGIKGELAHTWKGQNKKQKDLYLNWKEYKELKKIALKRDGFCCVFCKSNKKLELDHIKPRFFYPELTFELSNVRILCHNCHKNTKSYGASVKKLNKDFLWE